MAEPDAGYCILPATRSDIDAVCAIAEVCFPQPWPRAELTKELERDYATLRVLRRLADERAPIAGFIDFWHVQGEVQIMNVAVRPELRGQGFGSALLVDALRVAAEQRATFAVLEVRPSNGAAIRLYERHGFASMGRRPRYYSDNQEDALVMGRRL